MLDTLIRDQLIFGTHNSEIRQQALKSQWDLADLLKNARIIETAEFSSKQINNTTQELGSSLARERPGKYYKKGRNFKKTEATCATAVGSCNTCSNKQCRSRKQCLAWNQKCFLCGDLGYFKGSRACKGRSKNPRTR